MDSLSHAAQRFVLHWGEMGSRWGINRTLGQIHALLYISSKPLNAEEIAATLSVARSNVSTSLRELQAWGIVKMVHVLGDRRDYFESVTDVWELFRLIIVERFRREVEPTLGVLANCVAEAKEQTHDEFPMQRRLTELHEFFKTLDSWRWQLLDMTPVELKRAAGIGGKVSQMLRRGGKR